MTDKKRPFMSDDERALAGAKHRARTPAEGVPIVPVNEFEHSATQDFTPVSSALERVAEHVVLSERERMLLRIVWQHTANMEMRSRARRDTGDVVALERRLDDLQSAIVDIRGDDGTYGKIGALKERVDKADSRRWSVIMWFAGLGVAVLSAAFAVGVWKSSIETKVETLKVRIDRARNVWSQPEYPAAKESQ